MASQWIATLERHRCADVPQLPPATSAAAAAAAPPPAALPPSITIIADDADLATALVAVLTARRGRRIDEAESPNSNARRVRVEGGGGVSYAFVPNDTGVGGTSIVAADRPSLDGPLATALGFGRAFDGAPSSVGGSSSASSVPAIPPVTQLAACAATQQGVLVLALRGGIEGTASRRSISAAAHHHNGDGGGGYSLRISPEEERANGALSSCGAAAEGEGSSEVVPVPVTLEGFLRSTASSGGDNLWSGGNHHYGYDSGYGGGGDYGSGGADLNSGGGVSYSAALFGSNPHILLEETAAIAAVARFCCPLIGAAEAAAASAVAEGISSAPPREASLPAHLVILNVVSPPPPVNTKGQAPSRATEDSDDDDDGEGEAHGHHQGGSVPLPHAALDRLTASLEQSLLRMEPLYDPLTAARDDGAVARNTARALLLPPSHGHSGSPSSSSSPSGAFSSLRIVSITDPTTAAAVAAANTADDGAAAGSAAVNQGDEATLGNARDRLHFLWQLAATTVSSSSYHQSHQQGYGHTHGGGGGGALALAAARPLLRPSPSLVASRVAALVALTSAPLPPNALMGGGGGGAHNDDGANREGARGEGPMADGALAAAAEAADVGRRKWCEQFVRSTIQDRFYGHCHARQSRLTPVMVEAAYAAVVADCERVCSLVLGCASSTTSSCADAAAADGSSEEFGAEGPSAPLAALNIRGRMQEGLTRFRALAAHNAKQLEQQQQRQWGGGLSPHGKGGAALQIATNVTAAIPGAATATENVRIVFNRLRNDRRAQAVGAHAARGAAAVAAMAQTSPLALWYASMVEKHVPHQYRFWFTGHGALIVVGIVMFVVLSVWAGRD